LSRPEKAEPHRDEIVDLYKQCNGNLVRVHEELALLGTSLSYQALTAFCRKRGIVQVPKVAAGQYHFKPGEEMQHDTSPHRLWIAGQLRRAETASLVLCYSRMLFFQFYPRFRRFDCKLFLSESVVYMDGACERCMIDNTHLVVLKGTGRDMVPVPEMEVFAERYGFVFRAHEKGDANRSARVEKSFDFIENNFLAGRKFRDWDDANTQARVWCDKVNASFKRHIKAIPRELYATDHPHMKRLPLWVPPVYLLHQRVVDIEGYVSVNSNRFSVPEDFIGRLLEVRETRNAIEAYDGPRLVATHPRVVEPLGQRFTLPEHRRPRGQRPRREPVFEEAQLVAKAAALAPYVAELKKRSAGRGTLALRRLLRMVNDYPREPLLAAVQAAFHYGLYDLDRLERLVLRHIARKYFNLGGDDDDEG
jgi:hypothetical protein